MERYFYGLSILASLDKRLFMVPWQANINQEDTRKRCLFVFVIVAPRWISIWAVFFLKKHGANVLKLELIALVRFGFLLLISDWPKITDHPHSQPVRNKEEQARFFSAHFIAESTKFLFKMATKYEVYSEDTRSVKQPRRLRQQRHKFCISDNEKQ